MSDVTEAEIIQELPRTFSMFDGDKVLVYEKNISKP